jgi:hypothetical protein
MLDLSDGVHEDIGIESGRLTRTYDFDYDEIDRNLGHEPEPEGTVTMADAAALSLVIEHCLKAENLTLAGAQSTTISSVRISRRLRAPPVVLVPH